MKIGKPKQNKIPVTHMKRMSKGTSILGSMPVTGKAIAENGRIPVGKAGRQAITKNVK
jgi:hypothetical protein